ncbi:hypothetical protein ACIQMO_25155 [Streptomyces sp. NPDC091406]|uniref:hypothetical protein n=1 Tax=unclassified Streptomyces TaxID=2593676 RepID=UPI0038133A3F
MYLHNTTRGGEAVQYVSLWRPHGNHTLRVRVTGEHNGQSGASFVSIDRAGVCVD